MKFQQDGITFTADRGFARAVKDGAELWSVIDCFVKTKPTKEAVIRLHNFFKTLARCCRDTGNEEEGKE